MRALPGKLLERASSLLLQHVARVVVIAPFLIVLSVAALSLDAFGQGEAADKVSARNATAQKPQEVTVEVVDRDGKLVAGAHVVVAGNSASMPKANETEDR